MKLKEWIKYEMPLHEIIVNASIKDGSDSFLKFMIGISISCNYNHLLNLFDNVNKKTNINNKLYCNAFSINTDLKRRGRWGKNEQPIRRETIFETLKNKGYKKTSSGDEPNVDLNLISEKSIWENQVR